MTEPKFEGKSFKLGDREFVIPGLNWGRLRKLQPVLSRIRGNPTGADLTTEALDDFKEIIAAALARNYPEMKPKEIDSLLEECLDVYNAPGIFMSVMGLSGLLQGEMAPGMGEPIDWGKLYGHLITSTGWTYEYVEEFMTFPRLQELNAYWRDHPPVHLQVGAIFKVLAGGITSEAVPEADEEYGTLDQLIEQFQAVGGKIG